MSPSAAGASGVHASTIVVDRGDETPPSPIGMPVENVPAEAAGKRMLFRRTFGA